MASATGEHEFPSSRAALARQRHQALERTVVAADPQGAKDKKPAAEEAAELPFDEVGQPHTVGAPGGNACEQAGGERSWKPTKGKPTSKGRWMSRYPRLH